MKVVLSLLGVLAVVCGAISDSANVCEDESTGILRCCEGHSGEVSEGCPTPVCDARCEQIGGTCVAPGVCRKCPDDRFGDFCEKSQCEQAALDHDKLSWAKRREMLRPQCLPDGSYAILQCHHVTGICHCAHRWTGEPYHNTSTPGVPDCSRYYIPGSRPPSIPVTSGEDNCTETHGEWSSSWFFVYNREPQCDDDGHYITQKCNRGYCVCVNRTTGVAIENTRRRSNDSFDCGSSDIPEPYFAEIPVKKVCFGGKMKCFNNSLPCHRLGFPPTAPDKMGTKFLLFTRSNRHTPDILVEGDNTTLGRFDPRKKTKVVIHGWLNNANVPHIKAIKTALLRAADVNVIMIDWSEGANQLYSKSHINTWVVGRQTANLLRYLSEQYPETLDIHVIGHSLGAHAAGYVGEEFRFVDRITGLDPAGPLFRDDINGCQLDKTDANFVDVIHTGGRIVIGYGTLERMGHQDFYPNSGVRMPGCWTASCSHQKSVEYFVESINDRGQNSFDAYRCSSWRNFKSDLCTDEARSKMGYYCTRDRPEGKYYLKTPDLF